MNFIYLFITIFSLSIAQLSVDAQPPSIIETVNGNVPVFITSEFNLEEILKQDNLDLKEGHPYKFGHNFNVDINFFDYAIVDTLSNGDKIFRFKISSPEAYSINLIFNSFYLPKGAELFIYDNDYSNQIGAFTYINNKSYNRFSTSPISGEQIILEYFEPFDISELAQITCIRGAYLKAIEEEDFSKFTSEIYLKGYLLCYAETMNLPIEKVLEDYIRVYKNSARSENG